MATEVHPADEETLAIVKDALLSSFSDKDRMPGHIPTWLPDGMGNAGYSTGHYVAVGCFDENGEASLRDGKVPEGRHAEVRRVRDGDGGDFGEILTTHEDGEEAWESAYTACSVRSEGGVPNVFFCERCYAYLEEWQSLPASASEGAQAPSAAELYEIVNSRKARRDEITGLLPDIDYDGIEASLNQWQSHFIACRRGSKHLAHAINTGLRGADLIPAILQDCRAWMFMRPDVWPESPKAMQIPTFAEYPLARGSTMPRIGNLPNELLLLILHDLPLPSLLALSATCRSLRALITAPAFLDQVLKEAMTQGSLRWLLPVEGLLDEHERACAALQTWMPEEHRPTPAPSSLAPSNDVEARAANAAEPPIKPLVMSPHFQRLAFVRACWQSDSMMNRKRLWGQVKQFEGLWEDYRLHGWQVDRFYA
ncbi:uncharacterized protein PHACADRAFT_262086 [Phanerochaete carnosa HHB-10118-sp]|uniref:F-box domain-containing protein n=1 Tax=Phanerochaete carnosa (strain HHB-10118-sp) TaxID=650164 RepID=K5VK59_PHACS|nr:uncharacterized protein PHACADRAFT_262086 [Phanerochaete carnosa HHB-10118-sp]EKM51758.1 hypothetical protein PHACADRAFT_262086 [Phanerochaete carnosa HHB-10118-sp]